MILDYWLSKLTLPELMVAMTLFVVTVLVLLFLIGVAIHQRKSK